MDFQYSCVDHTFRTLWSMDLLPIAIPNEHIDANNNSPSNT